MCEVPEGDWNEGCECEAMKLSDRCELTCTCHEEYISMVDIFKCPNYEPILCDGVLACAAHNCERINS